MNKVVHTSLLTVVLAAAVYGIAAAFSGGQDVWQAIISLDPRIWAAILGLSLFNYLLRYFRWHLYITHKQPLPLTHGQHLAIYIAGFSLTMTPGKAGEAMRSLYLRQHGVEHHRTMGALFVERIMDLLTILMLAGFGASFLDGEQSRLAAIITIGLISGCVIIVKMPKKRIIQSRLVQSLPEKLKNLIVFVENTLDNANDLLTLRFLLLGLAIGLVAWLCEGYGLFLVMQAFNIEHSTVFLAFAIYGMGILLGALSMSPGGLGASELAMAYLLVKAGFDAPSSVAITYICRFATLWFAVVLGVITMFFMSALGVTAGKHKES